MVECVEEVNVSVETSVLVSSVGPEVSVGVALVAKVVVD